MNKPLVIISPTEIVMKIPIRNKPTYAMRVLRFGLDKFMAVLRENKWADEKDNALKNIKISQGSLQEGSKHFIQWTAVLLEKK